MESIDTKITEPLLLVNRGDDLESGTNHHTAYQTCEICYDDAPAKDFYTLKCSHTYMRECLQLYYSNQLLTSKAHLIQCPNQDCRVKLS